MLPSRRQSAFSYIEILVVMLVTAVMTALVVAPRTAARERKKIASCADNLRRLHLSLGLYANEHEGALPGAGAKSATEVFLGLMPKYTSDAGLFACSGCEGGLGRVDYSYVAGLRREQDGGSMIVADRMVSAGAKSAGAQVFSSKPEGAGSNHAEFGGNVLFVDGHVESLGVVTPRELPVPAHATFLNP